MSSHSPSSTSWRHLILTDRSAIDGILPAWNDLFAKALEPVPFVAPYWLLSWWDAFSTDGWEVRFVTAWRGDELHAVLPAYVTTDRLFGRHVRVLKLWEDPHSNRIFPLLRDGAAADAAKVLTDGLRDPAMDWDLARFGLLPREHPAVTRMLDALAGTGLSHGLDEGLQSPVRSLPSSWAILEDGLSSSFRSTVRRKRNLARRNDLKVEMRTTADAIEPLFAISRLTWQHAEGTGLDSTPELRAFYGRIIEEAAAAGHLIAAVLKEPGGRPIAFELNLRHDGVVYNLKVGYDPDFGELSPGMILRDAVLRRAVEDGATTFDFLGDAEPYKMHWADALTPHANLVIARSGVAPRLYCWLKFGLRSWIERRAPWLLRLKRHVRG